MRKGTASEEGLSETTVRSLDSKDKNSIWPPVLMVHSHFTFYSLLREKYIIYTHLGLSFPSVGMDGYVSSELPLPLNSGIQNMSYSRPICVLALGH